MGAGEYVDAVARAFRVASQRGTRVRIPCPRCAERRGREDSKRALSVSVRTGRFMCWRCDLRGRLIAGGMHGFSFTDEEEEENTEDPPPPEGYLPLHVEPYRSAECTREAREYLRGRGLPVESTEAAHVGCVLDGYYAGRVVVPLIVEDEWHGWVARTYLPHLGRTYLYPRGMRRGEYLYNEDALQATDAQPLFIVEGALDALALWPDAVAVLGKPSHRHVEKLSACKRELVVALDGDAWEEAWALTMRLRFEGARAGFVRLPPGKDPDEVERGWLEEEGRRALSAAL